MAAHTGAHQGDGSLQFARHGEEFFDPLRGILHPAVIHRFHPQIEIADRRSHRGDFGTPGTAFLAVRKHHSIDGLTQETPPLGRYRRMALDEEQSNPTPEMPRAIDWLRDCADLAGVDPSSLESPAAGAGHFSLPGGSLLFAAASASD